MSEKLERRKLENEIPLSIVKIMQEPILVTRTCSVSGKLYLAAELQKFDTIGIDAVATALNDLAVMQAKPLSFYDNISCARSKPEKINEIESGCEEGCSLGGIRYAGSNVKELSDIFSYDQYDLVGFATGVYDKEKHMVEQDFRDGDVIIGLPSNGLHNNGYVVARKKLYLSKNSMDIYYETLGATLGEMLLLPTKLYQKPIEAAYASGIEIKSCKQVTHGGLDRAVRELLHNRAGAVIKQKPEHIPPLYDMLHKDGNISEEQMRKTFNMGMGMLLVVAEQYADAMMEVLEQAGEQPLPLGLVERDTYNIRYII